MFPPLRQTLLTVLFLFLMSNSATAQYRFDNWTTKDGLPQNTVAAITQTPDGYLWLATAVYRTRVNQLHRETPREPPTTNNMPSFIEFLRDTQAIQRGVVVGQGNWLQVLDANRTAF